MALFVRWVAQSAERLKPLFRNLSLLLRHWTSVYVSAKKCQQKRTDGCNVIAYGAGGRGFESRPSAIVGRLERDGSFWSPYGSTLATQKYKGCYQQEIGRTEVTGLSP